MKYKVGDKVKIKSLNWYNTNKNKDGNVECSVLFTCPMSQYCGKTAIIIHVGFRSYNINLDNGHFFWTDNMFEENFNNMEINKITIPKGWEVNRVEGNGIILKESKEEFPKTWKECCKKLGKGEYIDTSSSITYLPKIYNVEHEMKNTLPVDFGRPMLALMQLLVCRDVYRQGWKPSLGDVSIKYVIYNCCNKIEKGEGSRTNYILSFKLEEVRNKFLENFRDLIEEAKELI